MLDSYRHSSEIVQPVIRSSNTRTDMLDRLRSGDRLPHRQTAHQTLNSLIVLLLAKDRYTFQMRLQPDTLRMWCVMTVEVELSDSMQGTTAKAHTREPHRRTTVYQRWQITALVHAGSLPGQGGAGHLTPDEKATRRGGGTYTKLMN